MSINRMLTRMAVVSALSNFNNKPWPTVAGRNIFDSKIEPVEEMKADEIFPVAVVYTDYDKDHWNKGRKAHDRRVMTVTIELLVIQAEIQVLEEDEPEVFKIECPQTDSEIETTLDIFEAQVFRALASDHPAAELFNHLAPSYQNAVSRRGATVEGGQRLAARQITLELEAHRDPILKVIPPEVEKFLTVLETSGDYGIRVPAIREFMLANQNATDSQIAKRMLGYTKGMAELLSAPVGPTVLLPANLTFIPN